MDNKIKEKAESIFKTMPNQKELFLNDKGEFFTNENLCKNSVKDAADYSKVERDSVIKLEQKEKVKSPGPTDVENEKNIGLEEIKKLTIEELKAKGDGLKEFLDGLSRDKLNALDPLFDFSMTALQNKEVCVVEIIKALA